jgi:cytochrome c
MPAPCHFRSRRAPGRLPYRKFCFEILMQIKVIDPPGAPICMQDRNRTEQEEFMTAGWKIRLAPSVAAVSLAAGAMLSATGAQALDADAARALARQSNCFKCHAIDKKKDGPAWKEVAKKFKGKADAEAKLTKHITTGAKVKLEDGTEDEHPIVKTKDQAAIKNLVDWILSL